LGAGAGAGAGGDWYWYWYWSAATGTATGTAPGTAPGTASGIAAVSRRGCDATKSLILGGAPIMALDPVHPVHPIHRVDPRPAVVQGPVGLHAADLWPAVAATPAATETPFPPASLARPHSTTRYNARQVVALMPPPCCRRAAAVLPPICPIPVSMITYMFCPCCPTALQVLTLTPRTPGPRPRVSLTSASRRSPCARHCNVKLRNPTAPYLQWHRRLPEDFEIFRPVDARDNATPT
jgi:hypothetical protein